MDGTSREGTESRSLRAVTAAAAALFTEPPRQKAAIAYLRQRGIDAYGLSAEWVLGYAPPGWTRLVDRLRLYFSEQALLDAGVARRCSRGTLIDTFRDRVMFGIRDTDGTIAGFIGRDLSGHPSTAKYLNTRQHALFDKGALVYGLFEGTRAGGARQPVVVEGPLDVLAIAARQSAGNSFGLLPVAPSGTAVTVVQARRVAEVALDNRLPVVVAMDGDAPGRAGALTAGEHLRNAGVDVRIATLPNGTDPAEHIARPDGSVDVFHADHGLPLVTARIEEAVARQGDSIQWAEGRLRAVRDITRYLATYSPDYAARQVAGVATRLGFDAHTVTTELADAFHARHVEVGRGKRAGVHVDL